ncbi:unnamed protein product, partial [Amoebophrya sp. A25]
DRRAGNDNKIIMKTAQGGGGKPRDPSMAVAGLANDSGLSNAKQGQNQDAVGIVASTSTSSGRGKIYTGREDDDDASSSSLARREARARQDQVGLAAGADDDVQGHDSPRHRREKDKLESIDLTMHAVRDGVTFEKQKVKAVKGRFDAITSDDENDDEITVKNAVPVTAGVVVGAQVSQPSEDASPKEKQSG